MDQVIRMKVEVIQINKNGKTSKLYLMWEAEG
jgi:hypothetical protein